MKATQHSNALGRYLGADGSPLDGGASLAGALPALGPARVDSPAPDAMLESGIKVVDMFAPLVRGGAIALVAGAGVGKFVLIEELTQRVATRRDGAAVLASLDDDGFDASTVMAELRSGGVEPYTAAVLGRRDEPAGTAERLAQLGLALAEDLCRAGRETLLFLDELLVTPTTVERLRARAAGLTLLVMQHATPLGEANAPLDALLAEGDGRLVLSRVLGGQNIWPAVDPVRSESRLLAGETLSAEHRRVAAAARALLRETGVTEGAGATDAPLYGRARRALLFGSQPFVVAEPFTALPGTYVPLAETIRDYAAIVDGRCDALPEEAVTFTGALDALPSGA